MLFSVELDNISNDHRKVLSSPGVCDFGEDPIVLCVECCSIGLCYAAAAVLCWVLYVLHVELYDECGLGYSMERRQFAVLCLRARMKTEKFVRIVRSTNDTASSGTRCA